MLEFEFEFEYSTPIPLSVLVSYCQEFTVLVSKRESSHSTMYVSQKPEYDMLMDGKWKGWKGYIELSKLNNEFM